MKQLPVNAKEIIPHRGPMLLLDELVFSSPELMRGKAVIKPDNLFVGSRGLDGACFVELLAQLAAAGDGYESVKADKPVRSGFLVGVNDFAVRGKAFAGDALDLQLQKGLQLNGFTVVKGNVYRGMDLLAQGDIKLFVTDPALNPAAGGNQEPDYAPGRSGVGPESAVQAYFRKNLSEVRPAGQSTVRARIRFLEDFPAFRGHFPGFPIVPGIALLHLVVFLSEELSGRPMALADVERAKFSRQVLPGDVVDADVSAQQEADVLMIKAGFTIQGKPAGTFSVKAKTY